MLRVTANQVAETLPLEQLRDLYERIPFARGRARVALLHRLRRVTTELRQARDRSGDTGRGGDLHTTSG